MQKAAADFLSDKLESIAGRQDASDADFLIEGLSRAVREAVPVARISASSDRNAARVVRHNLAEFRRLRINTRAAAPGISVAIEEFRRKNVGLIQTLADTQVRRIEKILSKRENLRVEDLQKEILRDFGITRRHASLIARDQVLKLNGQITSHRQRAAGIEEFIWTTSRDERVRPEHKALDGKRFRWDAPPSEGIPGERFQCRCTPFPVVPALDDEDDLPPLEQGGGQPPEPPLPSEPPRGPGEPGEPSGERREQVKRWAKQATAAINDDLGRLRDLTRLELGRAGVHSRDVEFGRPAARRVAIERTNDFLGLHNTKTGELTLSTGAIRDLRRTLRALQEDTVHQLSDQTIDSGLSTLIHEELHGASALGLNAYSGTGLFIEEAITETLARSITSDIVGRPVQGFAYNRILLALRDTVQRVTGLDAGEVGVQIERAALRTRQAHSRSYSTGNDQIDHFADELEVTDDERATIKALLKRIDTWPT